MLKIYDVVLVVAGDAARIAERIERKDRDLARQLRRAMQSVALNVAEGMGSLPGHKRQRYSSALGSAREVLACVQIAQAMHYIDAVNPQVLDRIDHVIATLGRLVYRRAS